MGRELIKVLAAVLGLRAGSAVAAACVYPDEGTMPLHRAITRVKLLPVTEAWARTERDVQYALFLEKTKELNGRCYWTVEARSQGRLWRRFYVTPDGRRLRAE